MVVSAEVANSTFPATVSEDVETQVSSFALPSSMGILEAVAVDVAFAGFCTTREDPSRDARPEAAAFDAMNVSI